jgi:hypothetical protein
VIGGAPGAEASRTGRPGAFALLVLAPWALTGCSEDVPAEPGPSVEAAVSVVRTSAEWAQDDRLVSVIQSCPGLGPFDRDTSEMLPILVSKLERAQLNVLRNVREELAELGEPAMVEIDRLVRRVYTDPFGSPAILNALGVVQLSDAGGGERAQELLRHCLGHPQDAIRYAAIGALGVHSHPGVYDDLMAILRVSGDTALEGVMTALYRSDRRRFEEEAVVWLEENKHSGSLQHVARLIAQGADEETARLCGPLITRVQDPVLRGYLVATQQHAPNSSEESFAILAGLLDSEDAYLRLQALKALELTEATELVVPVLLSDPQPNLRLMACGLLGSRIEEKIARDALLEGMDDAHDPVREASLGALLAAGNERARDTALSMLGDSQRLVGIAVRALKGCWEAHPGLADRALAILRGRFEARPLDSLEQREFLLQAVGMVPGPESTRWLLDLATERQEQIDRISSRRWLVMQASNTGPAGVDVLRERWRNESDPGLRFDLLWSGTLGHDEGTREFLLEVLEAERGAPQERLYAAERLAREGPASLVAPRIKRANLRMADPVFRPAMNCLLWRWYG